jgi:hypothetical protein
LQVFLGGVGNTGEGMSLWSLILPLINKKNGCVTIRARFSIMRFNL